MIKFEYAIIDLRDNTILSRHKNFKRAALALRYDTTCSVHIVITKWNYNTQAYEEIKGDNQ